MACGVEAAIFAQPGSHYGPAVSTPRTIDVLCALALFKQPKVIVEAGTFLGHTAISMASALKKAAIGFQLWTSDVCDHYYEAGFEAQVPAELKEEIRFFHGDFVDMLRGLAPIDFAYIDASREGEPMMRWRHFSAAWDHAMPGAILCVDDCAGEWPKAQRLRGKADVYLPLHRGLAIYQKKAKQYAMVQDPEAILPITDKTLADAEAGGTGAPAGSVAGPAGPNPGANGVNPLQALLASAGIPV